MVLPSDVTTQFLVLHNSTHRKSFDPNPRNKTNEREQKHYGVAFAGYNEAFSEGEWLDINTKEVLCLVTIDKVFFFQMFYLCLDT